MRRIDTTNPKERWKYCCVECGSTNWRANDGLFECQTCDSTATALEDAKTGQEIAREEIEFVGPETSWKAPYRDPV
jgi:ribosomal protein L37AE/L43A